MGDICGLVYTQKGVRNFSRLSIAMDPEVQRLVIGQPLVIVMPVEILWFIWINMLMK